MGQKVFFNNKTRAGIFKQQTLTGIKRQRTKLCKIKLKYHLFIGDIFYEAKSQSQTVAFIAICSDKVRLREVEPWSFLDHIRNHLNLQAKFVGKGFASLQDYQKISKLKISDSQLSEF